MKRLKHFIFVFLLMVSVHNGYSQPVDQLRIFYFSYGFSQFPYPYYDSVVVAPKINDTLRFKTIALRDSVIPRGASYWQLGDKVYLENGPLLYDYSLKAGDTFFYADAQMKDTFLIDSVYNRAFAYRTHKIWRLKHSRESLTFFEWIHGMGTFEYGWDYTMFYIIDAHIVPVAMCLHDSLIYWDSTRASYFKVPKTCDFNVFRKPLSIDEQQIPSINLYPVPVSGILNIDLGSISSGYLEIYNVLGQLILEKSFNETVFLSLDLPKRESGLLYLKINTGGSVITRSFRNY